jgi:CheY-like chemotaxis protein
MEAIGTLAGGIAHDFNNILAAIMGFMEIAKFDLDSEHPASRNLDQALKASHRAKDLVKQILVFSRKDKQHKRPVRMNEVVKEAVKMIRATLPSTIEIRWRIDAAPMTTIADETQLHQMLMNLCSNAAHAMEKDGGILDVTLTSLDLSTQDEAESVQLAPGPYLKLTVKDTGCGMEKDILDCIFDPYFTTKGKDRGTGLGLSMVHGIVLSYGGTVRVESEPSKGSRFDVYLPRVQEAVEASSITASLSTRRGSEHILIVDDEKQLIDMQRQLLEFLGYKVTSHTSSEEALDAFRSNPEAFDLVVTDMTMPRMTGDQMALQMLSIKPRIPIVICTGYSNRISKEKAKAIGIKGLVLKPVVLREMAEVIRNALDTG